MAERSLRVPVIGLIGGVGSGKSSLARSVAQKRHIAILDADAVGHRVLAEPDIKRRIRQSFGDEVFHTDGSVNRQAVGRLVFGSQPEQRQARAELESIVHPRIQQELKRELESLRGQPGREAVILDAAVLLEAGWRPLCDAVVFVEAPHVQRAARANRDRGWTEEQLKAREASQWPLERKRKEADHVVDNSGSPEQGMVEMDRVLQYILAAPPDSA